MSRQVTMQYGSSGSMSRKLSEDWELIWQNEDPTTSFAAQIISLNLAKYGWIKVEACFSTSNQYFIVQDIAVEESSKGATFQASNLQTTSQAAGAIYSYSRIITPSLTGVSVSDCSRRRLNTTSDSANTTNNTTIIPTRIWGKTTSSSAGGDASFHDSGYGMRLLWTNPDVSEEFAGQTVSLDLSEYDAVFIPTVSSSGNRLFDIFADVGGATAYAHFVALATNLVARQRSAKATTTGVTFGNCQSRTQGSSSNTNTNTQLVPSHIYGVKFG